MKISAASRPNPHIREMPHKHYAVRLPVAMAERLEALCEMNPRKRRDQIICELLGLGLAELERRATDRVQGGEYLEREPNGPLYLPNGAFSEFHNLVRKHHYASEQALAKPGPGPEGPQDAYCLGDMQ